MPNLIVVTGASGRQCTHLLPLLSALPNYSLRLCVHSQASQQRLQSAYPKAEVVIADTTQPTDCARIVKNATTVYHIGPSAHAHETLLGYCVIDAAVNEEKRREGDGGKQGGVHFVYSSVLCTQLRKLMNHDCKRYVCLIFFSAKALVVFRM